MKKLPLYFLSVILISACASTSPATDKSDVTITGTKISKEAMENNEPVMVVKPGEGGATTLQDLLNAMAAKPFSENSTCSEALKEIEAKGIKIVSVSKGSLTTALPDSTAKIIYNFKDNDCPQ